MLSDPQKPRHRPNVGTPALNRACSLSGSETRGSTAANRAASIGSPRSNSRRTPTRPSRHHVPSSGIGARTNPQTAVVPPALTTTRPTSPTRSPFQPSGHVNDRPVVRHRRAAPSRASSTSTGPPTPGTTKITGGNADTTRCRGYSTTAPGTPHALTPRGRTHSSGRPPPPPRSAPHPPIIKTITPNTTQRATPTGRTRFPTVPTPTRKPRAPS